MRSVIEVERQRTAQGVPAVVDAEVISVRGRRSTADPRRRFGRHAEARRFLAENGSAAAVTPGVWDGLLNALRNHTIQDSLASLAAWERQVLHLAFLEGRTNREIAAILSISRSTVRRRIVVGLASLDDQLRRVGTKASAVLLLVLASAVAGARMVGRPLSALRATPAGNVILTTAAGAVVGAAIVGAVVSTQSPAAGNHGSTRSVPRVTAGAPLLISAVAAPSSTIGNAGPSELPNPNTAAGTSDQSHSSLLDPGCDGNPTNAPAATPVGPRATHGQGQSPVTHPPAGGCGPHGVEGP